MIDGDLMLAGNTINTTTPEKPLEIQSHAQSPVQFMGGLVEFFTNGDIKTEGSIEAEEFIGSDLQVEKIKIKASDTNPYIGKATIPAGETEVVIETKVVQSSSFIYLTATSSVQGDQIYVKDIQEGKGFTVAVDEEKDLEIRFNWWIVEEE